MSQPKHCKECPSAGQGIFCELENLVLDEISEHKISNQYKKGQHLFVEGKTPYGIYCISKGNIKLTKTCDKGKNSIFRIVSEGDVLGHQSIFTDSFFSATATAIEDTTVCFINKKYIIQLVQENPSVASQLLLKLSRDLGASEQKIASFHQKNVRERLAELLLLLKQSHGKKDANGKIFLDIKLTRDEMASIINTAQETLIRFMSELKEAGLIEQKGKTIYVSDEKGLMEAASLFN